MHDRSSLPKPTTTSIQIDPNEIFFLNVSAFTLKFFKSSFIFDLAEPIRKRATHVHWIFFFIMLSETDDHIYSNQSANEIINLMFPQLHLNFRSSLLFLIRLSQSESNPQMFLGFCFPQIAQYFNL